ncbi:hypothetical protein DL95DRAFT_386743 [Leptodontidium sp. 2 PMI_412]|nr:hypothetical protein DL95DRAFT_386743 [Leptodontidium sp. 2 PMI_412]
MTAPLSLSKHSLPAAAQTSTGPRPPLPPQPRSLRWFHPRRLNKKLVSQAYPSTALACCFQSHGVISPALLFIPWR